MSLENAKRQRLDKLERRRFEVPLEFQSMEFAYNQSLIFQQMATVNINQQAQAQIDSNTIVYSNGKDRQDRNIAWN
ncbi:regulator of telomere elongation helicase 1 [Dorcoceras hygrometricum]|uniref:Regulator of telomere elongation helicase 1 n=1 Tax=Dorcoceras hygrometricum TaxID=472368 RepID=A0A2Z7C583_9LAMI|nr:regulator of telomere elongation helicase 1 [Dorcoceras hygrometricum]